MNTLDRIKIKIPIASLGRVEVGNCTPKVPYKLKITILKIPYAYIEFSSKILGDDYPELINMNNIGRCLERVKDITRFDLNIDDIINHGIIVSCDITKDVPINNISGINSDFKRIKNIINLTNKNHLQYTLSAYRNGSITVNKAVCTNQSRYRLTIYDKNAEIKRKNNEEFLESINDKHRLLNYFADKVRFEIKAYTSNHLKQWMRLEETKVIEVLTCETNALQNAMLEVFAPINISDTRISAKLQEKIGFLKLMNWDMSAIEASVREHDYAHASNYMKLYRDLCLKYDPQYNDIQQLDVSEWVA